RSSRPAQGTGVVEKVSSGFLGVGSKERRPRCRAAHARVHRTCVLINRYTYAVSRRGRPAGVHRIALLAADVLLAADLPWLQAGVAEFLEGGVHHVGVPA